MLVSNAQNFEDILLWRAVGDAASRIYVDVGAQDPERHSVSLAFYRAGWRGIHVEPHPDFAARLRAARPGDTVIEAAVGAAPGRMVFHIIGDTGLSTGDPDIAAGHRASGRDIWSIEVPVVTLDDILAAAGSKDIAWLKIDVEGMEPEVIAGWRGPIRPLVVVVEVADPLDVSRRHHDLAPALRERGYVKTLFDGLNDFFVREDQPHIAARLDYGACLFDDAALGEGSAHPFRRLDSARIDELTRALTEARGTVERLNRVLASETRRVEELAAALAERDAALAQEKDRAAAAEAMVEALLGSVSWRVTAPLRRWSARLRSILAHPATPPVLRYLATMARRAVVSSQSTTREQRSIAEPPLGARPLHLAETLAYELETAVKRISPPGVSTS